PPPPEAPPRGALPPPSPCARPRAGHETPVHRPLADARVLAPLAARTVLTMWSAAPGVMTSIAGTAIVYARGWRRLRRRGCVRVGFTHLAAFMAGLAALLVALAGPL